MDLKAGHCWRAESPQSENKRLKIREELSKITKLRIITEITKCILSNSDLTDDMKINCLNKLSQIEYNLLLGKT